jgi:hypothetical protein
MGGIWGDVQALKHGPRVDWHELRRVLAWFEEEGE